MFRNVSVLEGLVGFFETLFQIAPRFFDRCAESALPHREITFRSDLWRIWFQCFVGIEHMGQLFILDLDQLQRLFGDVSVCCRYCGHRITDVADRVVEDKTSMGVSATRPGYLSIAMMNHGFDPG